MTGLLHKPSVPDNVPSKSICKCLLARPSPHNVVAVHHSSAQSHPRQIIIEILLEEVGTLGLRDGLDHCAHHVMPRPRFSVSGRQAVAVFHSRLAIRWSVLRSSDWLMVRVSKAKLLSSIAKVGLLVDRWLLKRGHLAMPCFVVQPCGNAALGREDDFQHQQF